MKRFNTQYDSSLRNDLHTRGRVCHTRAWVWLGIAVVVLTSMACSTQSTPATGASQPVSATVPPASLQTVAASPPAPLAAGKATAPVKSATAKPMVFKSRDYGVSFVYPWQYAYVSARTIAKGDPALRPNSDGHEGQVTLARIEVPKGFYPDTNFERGYFTLSLNQNLDEEECQAALTAGQEGKVESESINGVEYRWVESDSGGRGSAAKVRNYAAFTNGTCYELEIGVRTSNRDGLAREVDPDQVWERLNAILRTVEIMPALQSAPKVASATVSD